MEKQITCQKQMIEENEEKIKAMLAEIETINHLFEDTKEELNERTEQLQHITNTLHKTQKTLQVTTQDRNEQKFLVGEHVKSEKGLHSEATQLLDTVQESTGDVSGLHSKLDRKKAVEKHNMSAQQKFQFDFKGHIQQLHEGITSFEDERLQQCSNLQQNLGERIEEEGEKTSELMKKMSTASENLEQQIHEMSQQCSDSADRWRQWAAQSQSQIDRHQEEREQSLGTFISDVFTPLMRDLQSQFNSFKTSVSSFHDQMQQQLNTQRDEAKSFQERNIGHLDSLVALVNGYHKTQTETYETQKSMVTQMVDRQKAARQKLMDQMKTLLQEQADLMTSDEQQITQNIETTQECTNCLQQDFSKEEEEIREEDKKETSANQMQYDTLSSYLSTHVSESTSTVAKFSEVASTGEQQVVKFTGKQLEKEVTQDKTVKESISTHMSDAEEYVKELNSRAMTLTSDLCNSTTDEIESLQSNHAAMTEVVTQWSEDIGEVSSDISQWTESHREQVDKAQSRVEGYIKGLKEDVPTGTTPQRRDFAYPSRLTITDPHDHLLHRFRTEIQTGDAPNVPLPDDSIELDLDSMQSRSRMSSNEASLDTSMEVLSSRVSATEDVSDNSLSNSQADESKENFVAPAMRRAKITVRKGSRDRSRTPSNKSGKDKRPRTPSGNSRRTPMEKKCTTTPSKAKGKPTGSTRLPLRVANNTPVS